VSNPAHFSHIQMGRLYSLSTAMLRLIESYAVDKHRLRSIWNSCRMSLSRFCILMALVMGLAACVTHQPTLRTGVPEDMTAAALEPLNAFRAQNGLGPVVADQALVGVASRQVQAMAAHDVLSHEIDGDFTTRINAAGFALADAAENVGAGHPTVENAIKSWIASPHHRDNMLLKTATRVALVKIDAPQSRFKSYWALEIASGQARAKPVAGAATASTSLLPGLLWQ